MRLERRQGYWLVEGGPVPPGATAITIGSVVIARPGALASPRLERHELEHVRQWRRHGPVGFLVRYLGAYARWRLRGYPHNGAYRRIPFEIEAEWIARRETSTSEGAVNGGRRVLASGRLPRRS
ncbi:MAG: hypothetical protein ACRD29_12525 [Acidimicrobiales bacterium]